MTSHSIAIMMLGIAIGGSVATTVMCLCAAARCADCRFHFGPEWPDEDLPTDGDQPSVYTPPANVTVRPGSRALSESPTTPREQADGCTQVGDGSIDRESRAGLGGLSPAGAACIDCGRLTSMTLSGLCDACSGRRKL